MQIGSAAFRVAVTLALPALALLACHLLRPWLDPTYDPLFIAASAITAWLCGIPYAFACVLLSALALDYFFLAPYNSFELLDAGAQTKFFLFLGSNSIIILLIHYARSAREAQTASEMRYRSLAELIPFGGWVADSSGNMTRISASFLNTFNITMEECRGLGWTRLLDEADRKQVLADWKECVRSGYFWDYEYRLRNAAGEQFVVLSRGIPVPAVRGKHRTWVGIHLDITERERSTEQRVQQARDLERFNAELEQFAYVSAHDLQEPLRMIASYLQLLSRRYQGKLDAEADTFIQYAVEGAERLKSLLQDLLQLQQVGKANRVKVKAPLTDAAIAAENNLSVRIAATGARISIEELPTVEYDLDAFVKVFEHLFENALKYHREGMTPEIHVSAAAQNKQIWEVRVRDNGIGIPAEYQERIFQIFQRLHPRSEYPGTGIGLAICKKVVEVHGGHLSVQSTPGEGSVFYFAIPAIRGPGA
ncbi:MAG TPA: ATP-binding protein [Bryobacteraceae bacterium]|nr:ATP-binding protein [Bryobacteraceae bacterium]